MSRATSEFLNYRTRPNKSIERKMMAEALAHLKAINPLPDYRYVGLGGLQFADFELFHRALGFEDMVSIEGNATHPERFEFNRPYGCIRIVHLPTTQALPAEIPADKPCVVWLDYDGPLESYMLNDVRQVAMRASSGSALIITTNAEPVSTDDKEARDLLREEFGDNTVEDTLVAPDLLNWGQAEWYYSRLSDSITKAENDRLALDDPSKVVRPRQVFNFNYKDGQRMMTVGWLLATDADWGQVRKSGMHKLQFIRTGDEAMVLQAPHLTLREIHDLMQYMPNGTWPRNWLKPKELKHCLELYRYYPKYFDVSDA